MQGLGVCLGGRGRGSCRQVVDGGSPGVDGGSPGVAAGNWGLGDGSGCTVDGGSSGGSISEGGSGSGCDDVVTVAKVEGSSLGYSVIVVRRVTTMVSSATDRKIAKAISMKVATRTDKALAIVE